MIMPNSSSRVRLLQLIPSNGNAANIQDQKKKTNRTEMKQDTIPANLAKEPANPSKKEAEEGERNVMLNACLLYTSHATYYYLSDDS